MVKGELAVGVGLVVCVCGLDVACLGGNLRVGVKVDGGGGDDVADRGVLDGAEDLLCVLRVVLVLREGDCEEGRLDGLCDVDELLEAGHAEGDVLLRDASVVEGVEGHLRGGLADGLRGEGSDRLSGGDDGLDKAFLDGAQHVAPRDAGEAVVAQDGLCCEQLADDAGEQRERVVLSLLARGRQQRLELRQQRLDVVDNCGGREALRHREGVYAVACGDDGDAAADVAGDSDLCHEVGVALVGRRGVVGVGVDAAVEAADVLQRGVLLLELGARRGVALDEVRDLGCDACRRAGLGELFCGEAVARLDVLVGSPDEERLVLLHVRRVERVLAVEELEDGACGVAHSAVVLALHVLHALHQAPLRVARLACLHSSVAQTLTPAHCVEEELLRRQACQVRVHHKAAAQVPLVVLRKVRQRPVHKAERYALPLHVLLPHARQDLRDVDCVPLRPRVHCALDAVPVVDTLVCVVSRLLTRVVQRLVHVDLERLLHREPGLDLRAPVTERRDLLLHLQERLVQHKLHVLLRLLVRDVVADPDGEPALQQPAVHHLLRLPQEDLRALRAQLLPDRVRDAPARARPDQVLLDHPAQQLPVRDHHCVLLELEPLVPPLPDVPAQVPARQADVRHHL